MNNEPRRPTSSTEPVVTPDLSVDVAFEVLADDRRRAVVSYLVEGRQRADLEDLAAHVTADADVTDEQAVATLHHLHLPKLADAGLIRYDDEQGSAVATDSIHNLEPYLEWAQGRN